MDSNALNQQFSRYDQVRKSHTYRLAEDSADEFDEDYEIATLDFEAFLHGSEEDKARFAKAFARALEEIGFAVLTGHGVDPALYDEIGDGVVDLFASTSFDDKLRFRAKRHGSVAQGYFPLEATSDIHPDLVEGWVWCRRAFDIPQHRDAPFRPEAQPYPATCRCETIVLRRETIDGPRRAVRQPAASRDAADGRVVTAAHGASRAGRRARVRRRRP